MNKELDESTSPPFEEELKLVDDDIAAVYSGRVYYIGTPILAQMSRELKLLRLELERQRVGKYYEQEPKTGSQRP